jgi:hypothetical protein
MNTALSKERTTRPTGNFSGGLAKPPGKVTVQEVFVCLCLGSRGLCWTLFELRDPIDALHSPPQKSASPKWLRFSSFNDPHLLMLHCTSRCFASAFPLHQLL